MANLNTADLVLIIIALFFPPITAAITDGCGQFCLNLLLTVLGFFPGLIHAIWLVFRRADRETTAGLRQPDYGRHHNNQQADNRPIYVQQPNQQPPQGYQQPPQAYQPPPPEPQNYPNYGTVPQAQPAQPQMQQAYVNDGRKDGKAL